MMEFSQPVAYLAQALIFLVAIVAGYREVWRLMHGRSGWWPLKASRIPRLPVPWFSVPGFILGTLLLVAMGMQLYALVLAVLVLFVLIRMTGRAPNRLWGLTGTDWGHTLDLGVRTYLGLLIPVILLTLFSLLLLEALAWDVEPQLAVQMFMEADGPGELLNLTLMAVFLMPLLEELIFRGFLYPAIKSHLGRGWAVASTSLLFGLSHAHLLSLLPLTALGVVLALVYDQTGRLGYAFALHSFFNFVTCALILVERYAG